MAPRLFEPVEIGTVAQQHRVVVAPLTRFKASAEHVPYVALVAEYYAQRATRPGTPLITEYTLIAVRAGGLANVAGIWGPARSRPGERCGRRSAGCPG
jgi:NADPH2 dehydrogenase